MRRFQRILTIPLLLSPTAARAHDGSAEFLLLLMPLIALLLSVVVGFLKRSARIAVVHAALIVIWVLAIWIGLISHSRIIHHLATAAFFLILLHLVVLIVLVVLSAYARMTSKDRAA